ncbi:YidC/Oxa1 family membrane protein insertase [Haloferula luteola]|uniref:Membrane protein insertase YidC n=1 Tax=Haloferula luteola TaxID=595692 RepID=A0A840VDJ2_9BACT|nr:membrane protein insertase YidC [Haloferula luteola]MBB5350911.1 YidC/Oxa1 family membrane protein insertase [Haloferula luteola]
MYDRKTWIVVVACSLLIAVNLYFGKQNAAAEQAAKAKEALEAPAQTPGEDGSAAEPGVLVEVEPEPSADRQTYQLSTAGVRYTFSTLGGSLTRAELLNYPAVKDAEHLVTLNDGSSYGIGTLCQGADAFEHVDYKLLEDQSIADKKLVFGARHPSGLLVRKTWELFEPKGEKEEKQAAGADYLLRLTLEVKNPDDAKSQVPLESFSLFLGRSHPLQKGENRINPATLAWLDDGTVDKIKSPSFRGSMFSKEQSLISKTASELDFASVSSQFFATVVMPEEVAPSTLWAKTSKVDVPDEEEQQLAIRGGFTLPAAPLSPGEGKTLSYSVFTGPKDNRMLRRMGGDWGEVMDYGWPIFRWPARFMNFLLVHVHDLVSKVSDKWSWGFAVILVTLLVRSAMWPLYARSNRSMKRMSKLKPEMDRLKEKYPDDPAKQQQEMMQLYRKFGINPVGGCLPMFAQIPIFFGFFRMLQHAVEMRGHGFLWVHDLSMPDTIATLGGIPINILPLVMGATSFVQMQMMPNTGGDKTQQAVMKFMPLMFLFFCYNYASALALYWTTSNLFSILQTWVTKKMPDPELKERAVKPGSSFMERMAKAAEEAQKQQKLKQAKGHVVEDTKSSKPRGPRTGG